MITNFKVFEKSGTRIEVGDYVKFKPGSGWYHDATVGNWIFKVIEEYIEDDYRWLIIKSIINEDCVLTYQPPHTLRHLTNEELLEMTTNKYNL